MNPTSVFHRLLVTVTMSGLNGDKTAVVKVSSHCLLVVVAKLEQVVVHPCHHLRLVRPLQLVQGNVLRTQPPSPLP